MAGSGSAWLARVRRPAHWLNGAPA